MTHPAATEIPVPEPGANAARAVVGEHLADLVSGPVEASSIRGGQRAADAALAAFDVSGYASARNEVFPLERRGASRLSPYIRHGLLSLQQVWDAVGNGPSRDVVKFRDELLWQEYARHWYGRLGPLTQSGVRRDLPADLRAASGWDRSMRCLEFAVDELETDGWVVNQTRMWLASQWAVRDGFDWRHGENEFFRHLLDGSRAANRLGWQWVTGVGSSKPYGFSRWQVEKRAPGLCDDCEHNQRCPIADWPDDPVYETVDAHRSLRSGDDDRADLGPLGHSSTGTPDCVWLTAESLGHGDPALCDRPDLPVIFVFDEPLLRRLQLSAKRVVFLLETLAEIGEHRRLTIYRGDPVDILDSQRVAATFAPVPGFRRIAAAVEPAALYPWPWLVRPTMGSVASFSAWRKATKC